MDSDCRRRGRKTELCEWEGEETTGAKGAKKRVMNLFCAIHSVAVT